MSGMGKSFSQFIRVTPHFMGLLGELQDAASEPTRLDRNPKQGTPH